MSEQTNQHPFYKTIINENKTTFSSVIYTNYYKVKRISNTRVL